MKDNGKLAWGIIGTGNIAHTFAKSMAESRTGQLVAVGSRQQESAEAFAGKYPGTRAHGSYENLLADGEVAAVYISTPHPSHAEWCVRAAQAGKHILCEKPLAMNHAEVMAAAEAARMNGVFLMEAFMYRCHPQTARVVEIIRSGQLGEVQLIEATFGFNCGEVAATHRLIAHELGGGGILDVGCYAASMTRLLAGAVRGRPFAEPETLVAVGRLGTARTDELAQALLTFAGGLQAHLSAAVRVDLGGRVVVTGTKGRLEIPEPWFGGHPISKLELTIDGKREEIEVKSELPLYSLEIDEVARSLEKGESPCMPVEDSLGNSALLDQWRKAIGLEYDSEKLATPHPRLPRLRPASTRPIPNLQTTIPALDPAKPVARMVLGAMAEGVTMVTPHAFALYDYYFELGGNIFDTAYIYSGGQGDRTLGEWTHQRGVRDQVTLIVKGAHTPLCDPGHLRSQLNESLDRLKTGHADIYMMHRDNPEIPVGEFIDVLNEEVRAGRIGIFGGSNWSLDRIDAANRYAAKKRLKGFSVLSNQFSLARMVDPVWGGCVCSSDAASRAWLKKSAMSLFAWSSQARGFFIRGARDFHADAELERCWYADDNFARLERVRELAKAKGTVPVNIAAAYVLQQPFSIFALIGPRRLSELESSLHAFEVTLTPAELAWLNLESDTR